MSEFDLTLRAAARFGSRFGFLSQSIFFRHLCGGSRARRYRHWKALLDDGWFVPMKSHPSVVYLSGKAKKEFALQGIRARSPIFVSHDSTVADILLVLENTGLVIGAWTEMELSRQRGDAFSFTGTDRVGKIPDLIVDLKTADSGNLRVAIEIEMSQKSRARYANIALSYLEMRRIDLVIFACSREQIAAEVRRAFRGNVFESERKHPGLLMIPGFETHGLETSFNYMNVSFTFRGFLEAATKLQTIQQSETTHEKVVSRPAEQASC